VTEQHEQPDQRGHSDLPRLDVHDPGLMRALAHPARLAIIEYLAAGKTGTATELGAVCGLTASATSYHLRALAKWGIIEDAPSRGDGRERIWRTGIRGWSVDAGPEAGTRSLAAERQLLEVVLARQHASALGWTQRMGDEPPQWYDAATLSQSQLLMTAGELQALGERVAELLRPYSVHERVDPPDGARAVSVVYRAYPVDGVNPAEKVDTHG
jgi:DNA-binding transcriptional ArsR family regulator